MFKDELSCMAGEILLKNLKGDDIKKKLFFVTCIIVLAASKLLSALLRKTFSVGSREKALKQVKMEKKKEKKKDLLKYKQDKTKASLYRRAPVVSKSCFRS